MTVPDDMQLDKMHPIISDVVMAEAPPPTDIKVTSPSPVTITTTTTIESIQTTTRSNQSDIPEVKLDTMHPIISEAAANADASVTVTTEDTDDLMKSTSDDLMTALEELNTVIDTSHTSSVGVVADHVSHAIKDKSSYKSNISDTGSHGKGSRSSSRQSDRGSRSNSHQSDQGSRSNSRQSDHDNRASRSSSRQSNTSSHDNRSGTVSSEDRHRKSPPAESARALYNFSAQSVK